MSLCYPLVTLEFSGGCELLFHHQSSIKVMDEIPIGTTFSGLVGIIRSRYIAERPELFLDSAGLGLRPGILALVNDVDIEVVGGVEYVVQDRDVISFVSTLHGG